MSIHKSKNRTATRKERPKPDPRDERIETVAELLSMFRGGDWALDTETFRDDCRWDARMIVDAIAAEIWWDGADAVDEEGRLTRPNPYEKKDQS